MKKNSSIANKKQYKKVPPEGGWGLLVCIGMSVPFVSALGSMPSFGLLFGDFLGELGDKSISTTIITSAFFSAMSFAGLFTNSLFKKYSIRTIALVGGILYFLGTFLQIFVQSVFHLLVAFSIIQGAAFGLIVPASYTTFNNYFVQRRVQMMSFTQMLIGLGTMFYPIVIHMLLQKFGFRGALAMLAGINAHAIIGMLVLHPVEWHMKLELITEEEMKVISPQLAEKEEQPKNNCDEKETVQPLMSKPNSLRSLDQSGSQRNSWGRIHNLKNTHEKERRASSIASLGNWTGPVVVSDASERDPRPNTKWQVLVDFLDLRLLMEPIYVNIALGISFAIYSDIAFFTMQSIYLKTIDFDQSRIAEIIAIGATADLISRVFLAISSTFVSVPSRYVYLAGALFTVVARFAFLSVFDFTGMAIITGILGFLRTWVHVPLPLVFSEYLPKERFPSGYGLFMFLQGNIMLVIGPVVGYICETTKSYPITFHCMNFFMAACAIPWLIEIIYLKCRTKLKQNHNENVEA